MKTAICFSGAIRSFNTCIPSIMKYLIEPVKQYTGEEPDIFVHMWNITEIDPKLDVKFKIRTTNSNNDDLINILKPKLCEIHEYDAEWQTKIISEIDMHTIDFKTPEDKQYAYNAICMYYKIMKACELKANYEKEHNFKYDVVIRARLDFILEDYVVLDWIKKDLSKSIVLPIDRFNNKKPLLITNDKYFASTSENVDNMCNIYNFINQYHKSNVKIEGQNLCNYRIRELKLEPIFTGHSNQYYKCQGRHDINQKRCFIYVPNINTRLMYELIYKLLYRGYWVVYEHISEQYRRVMLCFENLINKNDDYNKHLNKVDNTGKSKIDDAICRIVDINDTVYVYKTCNENANIKSNIQKHINYESEMSNASIKVNVDDIKQNDHIKICYNPGITLSVVNFLTSLVEIRRFVAAEYTMEDIIKIVPKVGEAVDYKIEDRGYFKGVITVVNPEKSISTKTEKNIRWDLFHPTNYVDYYQEGKCPVL